MYPAIIIVIVCTQIGQEVYTTRQERSNGIDLTTIHFTADDSLALSSSSQPTTSFADKLTPSQMSPAPPEG